MAGFLAVPYEIFDWFPGSPITAWLYTYLVLKANWEDSVYPLPAQKVCLKQGQLVCSMQSLADGTGLSLKQVRHHVTRLAQVWHRIGLQRGTHGTIITITNYKELFRDFENQGQTMWQTDGRPMADRWQHHNNTQENKEQEQEDTYVGSARADPTPYGSFLELWNQNRGQLASVQKITKGRKLKIKARLTEEPNLDYWAQTVKRMAASTFCCSGGWASFDWLTTNDTNHLKVTEGKYDNKTSNQEDMAFLERQRLRDEELERAGIRDWK